MPTESGSIAEVADQRPCSLIMIDWELDAGYGRRVYMEPVRTSTQPLAYTLTAIGIISP